MNQRPIQDVFLLGLTSKLSLSFFPSFLKGTKVKDSPNESIVVVVWHRDSKKIVVTSGPLWERHEGTVIFMVGVTRGSGWSGTVDLVCARTVQRETIVMRMENKGVRIPTIDEREWLETNRVTGE